MVSQPLKVFQSLPSNEPDGPLKVFKEQTPPTDKSPTNKPPSERLKVFGVGSPPPAK